MKKKFLVVIALQVALFFTGCAQSQQAPNGVIGDSFNNMFPNAKQVEWETEDGFFVAEFRSNGFEKEAWFDRNNTWVLTKTEYERKAPQVIQDAIGQTDYKGWKIDDVDFIEIKGENSFYIVEVERGEMDVDLYFSETGELLKTLAGDGDYHRELR